MALIFKVEVDYFDEKTERIDIVEVRESNLPTWLRSMASDIEQEGLKIVSISITVCGVLLAA